MQKYDWRRIMKLLRLHRPDCWDAEDLDTALGLRHSPYRIEPEGIFVVRPSSADFPGFLPFSVIEPLYPPDADPNRPILPLPATLPDIVKFLEQSGEYAPLPLDMWPRLKMRVVRAENFTVETHSANSQPSSVMREDQKPIGQPRP